MRRIWSTTLVRPSAARLQIDDALGDLLGRLGRSRRQPATVDGSLGHIAPHAGLAARDAASSAAAAYECPFLPSRRSVAVEPAQPDAALGRHPPDGEEQRDFRSAHGKSSCAFADLQGGDGSGDSDFEKSYREAFAGAGGAFRLSFWAAL